MLSVRVYRQGKTFHPLVNEVIVPDKLRYEVRIILRWWDGKIVDEIKRSSSS